MEPLAHRENYLAPRNIHRLTLVLMADGRGRLGSNTIPPAQAEMGEGQAGTVVTQASPGQGGTELSPDVLPGCTPPPH